MHPNAAAERGATFYLTTILAFRSTSISGQPSSAATPLAMDDRGIANYGGPTGGLPAGGNSAIWSIGASSWQVRGNGCRLGDRERQRRGLAR